MTQLSNNAPDLGAQDGHPGTRLRDYQDARFPWRHFPRTGDAPFCGTDRRVIHFQSTMEKPFADFDLERAIALRWTLRDIRGSRFKLSPVRDEDLQTLIDLGFVEMRDDAPVVTPAGLAALE